jgi:hypothetical protein
MDKPLLDWDYFRNAFLNKSNKNKLKIDNIKIDNNSNINNKSKPIVDTPKVKETLAVRVHKMFKKSKSNV